MKIKLGNKLQKKKRLKPKHRTLFVHNTEKKGEYLTLNTALPLTFDAMPISTDLLTSRKRYEA